MTPESFKSFSDQLGKSDDAVDNALSNLTLSQTLFNQSNYVDGDFNIEKINTSYGISSQLILGFNFVNQREKVGSMIINLNKLIIKEYGNLNLFLSSAFFCVLFFFSFVLV